MNMVLILFIMNLKYYFSKAVPADEVSEVIKSINDDLKLVDLKSYSITSGIKLPI